MKYPALRAYITAIADKNNINIPFFKSKSMQIYMNNRGKPFMSVGGFGAVFRFKDKNGNQYALKVFTSDMEGRGERYEKLHKSLQILQMVKFPFMVDFQYVADGMKVGENYFPAVVMEWASGIPIHHAIKLDLEDDHILQSAPVLAGSLYNVVKALQEWNMGHNDLQEGNVLVTDDNRMMLIDYDGMFVPLLDGQQSNELGLADYQHPGRNKTHFTAQIDDFSLLSILYQLSIINFENWSKFHDDKRLILSEADYKDPNQSHLIQQGLHSKEAHVKKLAELLVEACQLSPIAINALTKIQASPEIMDWMVVSTSTQPEKAYQSLIAQVMSIKDADLDKYESNEIIIKPKEAEPESIPNPQTAKKRKEAEAGVWGFIGNMLFEDTDEQDDTEEEHSVADKKKKRGFLSNLLFDYEDDNEKDEENSDNTPQQAPSSSHQPKPSPSVLKPKPSSSSQPSPEPQKNTDLGNKTAPLPDWMKKRKPR